MGPGAPPAPAQERRAPTIGAALLPTGSGPAPTRLLSYDAVTVGRAQTRPCRGATTEGVPARKSMSVAYRREYKKAYFSSTGRGDGANQGEARKEEHGVQLCPGVHSEHSLMDTRVRAIEHSQMDPTEGSWSTKRTTGCALTHNQIL